MSARTLDTVLLADIDFNTSNFPAPPLTPHLNSPVRGQDRAAVVSLVAQKYFSGKETDATRFVDSILDVQRTLSPHKTVRVPPSELFPNYVEVSRSQFYVYDDMANNDSTPLDFPAPFVEGTYSLVRKATAFTLKREGPFSPSRSRTVVRKEAKFSHHPFSPEKRRLDAAVPAETPGIDFFQTTDRRNGVSCSTHEAMSNDLNSIDYSKVPGGDFAGFLVPRLTTALRGLMTIHQGGYIHRDIKGGNILFSWDDGENCAKITDFSLLMKTPTEVHKTASTIAYLDPEMFGNAATTLHNQRYRHGLQDPQGDLYAFARLLERDILRRLLNHFGNEETKTKTACALYSVDERVLNEMNRIDRDALIEEFGAAHPYLSLIWYRKDNKLSLAHLQPVEQRRAAMLSAVEDSGLPTEQASFLRELIELTYTMLQVRSKRLSAEGFLAGLEALKKTGLKRKGTFNGSGSKRLKKDK